jgi:hypothetical protein
MFNSYQRLLSMPISLCRAWILFFTVPTGMANWWLSVVFITAVKWNGKMVSNFPHPPIRYAHRGLPYRPTAAAFPLMLNLVHHDPFAYCGGAH